MPREEQEDTTIYNVVVNHEEQYSIWPVYRQPPLGWKTVDKSGLKDECLAYIKEVWTDMRPLSLRKRMEEIAQKRAQGQTDDTETAHEREKSSGPPRNLVQFLSEGEHPVEAGLGTEKTVQRLKERIDLGYVHIKFTDTRGGTELGVRLDRAATDLSQANFETGLGTVHLVGNLTLDYVKVRCVADIDLATSCGQGHLEPVPT